MQIMKNL